MARRSYGGAERIVYPSLDLNDANPFTISFWVRSPAKDLSGSETQNALIWHQSGETANAGGVYWYGLATAVRVGIFNAYTTSEINNEWNQATSGSQFVYDHAKWWHLLFTSDGSTDYTQYKFYCDGIQAGTPSYNAGNGTGSRQAGTGRLALGCQLSGTPDRAVNGDIAEMAVWRAVLPQTQISALAKGLPADRCSPGSLEFYAPLRDGPQDLMGRPATPEGGHQVPYHAPIKLPNRNSKGQSFAIATIPDDVRFWFIKKPWQLVIHDTFEDTNGVDLDAHVPTPGSGGSRWSLHGFDDTAPVANDVEIQSNQLDISNKDSGGVIDCGSRDKIIEVVWPVAATGTDSLAIFPRWWSSQPDSQARYIGLYCRTANNDIVINVIITGYFHTHSVPFTWAAGETYTIKVVDIGNKLFIYIDGRHVLTFAHSYFKNTTKIGIGAGSGTSSSTRIDSVKVWTASKIHAPINEALPPLTKFEVDW